ncbi:hypothetical protein B484DRAFT_402322, partial [Ochromonadaceae sp. CCMP2298]
LLAALPGVWGQSRRLNTNPYGDSEPDDGVPGATFDVIDDRSWHAIKHISHYLLGILFACMAISFLLFFWQIGDYSNRAETKAWLFKYVSDGWWRRGGVNVALSMLKGCVLMGAVLLLGAAAVIPEDRVIGAFLVGGASVVGVVWALGVVGIRLTEAAFVRYVSQNVSYTSAIILKRAVKAKLDLALCCLVLIYTPLLYTLVNAVTVITDWNDTLATHNRQYSALPVLSQRPNGFYIDANILPCDSLLGD